MKSIQGSSKNTDRLKEALARADCVLIGAGAGLSTAGFTYGGARFYENFGDFAAQYGFADMYAGGFYPFDTPEEYWAYWSRYIMINRYTDPPKPVYDDLFRLVKDKDYFVLTTNVDHCFQKAGFCKERLFYTQGDYGLLQCCVPCHKKTYDNEDLVRRMVAEQKDRKVPSALVPHCPVCGKPLTMNLRCDDTFVQDEGWNAAFGRYERFLAEHKNKRTLYWELGVGGNTPAIVKYPFWRFTAANPRATYACVNLTDATYPPQIADRAIGIRADIGEILAALRRG